MYLITYFKYLYFNYFTTLQTNTQNNLRFSHALLAAHAVKLNTQNLAWFGSQISVHKAHKVKNANNCVHITTNISRINAGAGVT